MSFPRRFTFNKGPADNPQANFNARPTREYGILFRAATAQHRILHPIDIVQLCRVDVPVEHDYLHVLQAEITLCGLSGAGMGPKLARAKTG